MTKLTPHQETMLDVWQRHGHAEFGLRDPDAAIATMSANPYILGMPIGQALIGREAVYNFYKYDFLPNVPDDAALVPVDRIVAENHIVDQFIFKFTHSVEMPWKLPGIAPTGRKVEVFMIAVVGFDGDKMAYEHLMWDHALALSQIGVVNHPAAAIAAPSAKTVLDLVKSRKK